jgi:SAM-dependent methyltransferase
MSIVTRERLQAALTDRFGDCPPHDALDRDYVLYSCDTCCLEFSAPSEPGNASLYAWLTGHEGYYPPERWEWTRTLELLGQPQRDTRILEVGCGSGEFLLRAAGVPRVAAVGLDTEPTSVARCRSRGLEAHCATLDDYATRADATRRFDWVVAFHCLEHVASPLELVRSMRSLLARGGSLLISTPLSPMSYENLWFDPLNHPPHHLTRWSAEGLVRLARRLDMTATVFMPSAGTAIGRALRAQWMRGHGIRPYSSRWQLAVNGALHPVSTAVECWRQLQRPRYGDRYTADFALVQMTPEPGAQSSNTPARRPSSVT